MEFLRRERFYNLLCRLYFEIFFKKGKVPEQGGRYEKNTFMTA